MKLVRNTPIVTTDRLSEVLAFYTEVLGFEVSFWMPDQHLGLKRGAVEISFMAPEGPQPSFGGQGLTWALEVEDADAVHADLVARGLEVVRPLQDNPWGDRSFTVRDPVGIHLYVHHAIEPTEEFEAYFQKA